MTKQNSQHIDSIEDTTEVFRPVTQTTPTQDARSVEVASMAVMTSSNTYTQQVSEGRTTSRAE